MSTVFELDVPVEINAIKPFDSSSTMARARCRSSSRAWGERRLCGDTIRAADVAEGSSSDGHRLARDGW